MAEAVITISPEILGGTPVFRGTRVPVRTLLDYLEGGDSLAAFLEDFPTVPRELAVAFLERGAELVTAAAAGETANRAYAADSQ